MKKKLILVAACLMAVAATGGVLMSANDQSNASLLMQNVEALTRSESGTVCTGPRNWGHCQSNNPYPCRDTSACN